MLYSLPFSIALIADLLVHLFIFYFFSSFFGQLFFKKKFSFLNPLFFGVIMPAGPIAT